MISLKEENYYEVVKGNKFNRNVFTKGKTILGIDLFGKTPIEAYISSFLYTQDVRGYLQTNKRIRGYIGPVKTDFLYWDFDSSDITLAYEDTKELIERLEAAGVSSESIRVDYSGKKGFHVILPSADIAMLGARSNMHLIVKEVCAFFAEDLPTADTQIYIRTGIFRVVNSQHPDTKKFCIPLSTEEFSGNSLADIATMADSQKIMPEDFDRFPKSYKSVELAIKKAIKTLAGEHLDRKSRIDQAGLVGGILNGFPDGMWNSGFTSVAGMLHKHGISDEVIFPFLSLMNERGDNPMPDSALSTIVSSVGKYRVDEQYIEPNESKVKTFQDACDNWVKLRESCREIRTGFESLDKQLFNFDAGKMMVIAAYSRVGKTTIALHISKNITTFDSENGLFTSLEMSNSSLFYKASVIEEGGEIDSKDHTAKMLGSASLRKEVVDKWSSILIVDEPCLSTSQIDEYFRIAIEKSEMQGKKCRLLLIDYVELIKGTEDTKKLAQAARDVKNIAKKYDVRVILLAQLNRTGGDEYAEPTTNSIKGSGEIFNAADVVLAMWRSADEKGRIHVKELKNKEEEDGTTFDLIQKGLSYQETNYVPDTASGGDGFWGGN